MSIREKKEEFLSSFGELKSAYFNFSQIERFFKLKSHQNAFQVLSDRTCSDLDFEQLFEFLDRTSSKVGQQYLYAKLREISNDTSSTSLKEKLIEKLREDEQFRVEIQLQLSKLDKQDAYYINTLFQEVHIQPPNWFILVRFLSFTSIVSFVLMFINSHIFFVFLAAFLFNIVIHYWNKKNLYHYLASLPQLLNLQSVAKKLWLKPDLQSLNPQLKHSLSVIEALKGKMWFFRLGTGFQGDFEVFFWALIEIFKILFLLEPIFLFDVLEKLDEKRDDMESIFSFVGEVDILVATASLRESLSVWSKPNFIQNQKLIKAKGIYHPLISNCVKNDVELSECSMLITGSNMSGKTSFIRTIGINVITAQVLNTCFAEEFALPYLKIYSAIRISDDLMNDKSYYFEEVLTIKKMIEVSDSSYFNLFLLDEIFKGTNTVERISAGKAVLSHLAKGKNMVFVSTHDIELTELLASEYELYHFSEDVSNQSVAFDYQLKKGKLKNRNAIKILAMNQYPQSIIDEAIAISKTLDQS